MIQAVTTTGTVVTTEKTPEALSLQARLEQLEAAIAEGHAILDRFSQGRAGVEQEPASPGALVCVNRCQGEMKELNQRLSLVAELVGLL